MGAAVLITLCGVAAYGLRFWLGWFSRSRWARLVPNFILANGIGLLIPMWVWRDVMVIVIVIFFADEIMHWKKQRRLKREHKEKVEALLADT